MTIAPAWPMRRPGGAVAPAMNAAIGFLQFSFAHAAASSSALPPISPIMMIASVSGSSLNILITSRCDVPFTGSPPMPTQVLCPYAAARELPHRLVSQRAGARDHADVPLAMDVAGRNADPAAAVRLRPSPGVTRPGQFGPMSRVRLPRIAPSPAPCRGPGCLR